jgi:hypothetical protein
MKDCRLLIYVSDADEQTPSSYCGIADMLYSGGEQLSNCSTVDGLSADILQVYITACYFSIISNYLH